ncbi:hypothetical protein D478_17779 [Brevibacillus agri BAB-2500]|nr:hypothetical protein D478_17779 [Brevibacillus agri BAB-2500]
MRIGLVSSLIISILVFIYSFFQISILKTFVLYEFFIGVVGLILSGVIFSSYLGLDRKHMSNPDSSKVLGENNANKYEMRKENEKVKETAKIFFFFGLPCIIISVVIYLIT